VQTLQRIADLLPENFAAPILVVLHTGASPSMLPWILARAGPLPASHAVDGEPVRSGHIHIAPPDCHMLVHDGHIRLSHGPRENWARPAIDPLFRSVATAYGAEAIGVILSGLLNDGTAGLFEIRRQGGTTIVQDPKDAEAPSMPRSALENVSVDYSVAADEIAPLLVRLTTESERRRPPSGVHVMPNPQHRLDVPAAQTCPECGGALREEQLGTITQFRCHIGHVMTAEVLATAKLEMLENDLSACLRAVNERAELCREIARKHEALDNAPSAARWRMAADEASARANTLTGLTEQPWYDPESVPGRAA
jgi:two-component system chemotaxis response regulator CheB